MTDPISSLDPPYKTLCCVIRTSGTAGSGVWENGFHKLRSLEPGLRLARRENPITQSGSAMEIRGWKNIFGNMDGPWEVEEKWKVLISCEVSSRVIGNLSSQTRGRNTTIACFYFDFAAQSMQSSMSVSGSFLKQLVFGLEEIPEEISEAYRDRKNAISGQGLQI